MVNKMKKQKRLLLYRNIFFFLVIIAFSIIIVKEKSNGLLIPKVEEKFNTYLNNNYSNILKELKPNKVTINNNTYIMKVTSIYNNNHYFYLKYSKRKITDTYKKDYLEGSNLLTNIKNNIEKDIKNKTNISSQIILTNTLNNYTKEVQDKIIKEDNLLSLKIYKIKLELKIDKWDKKEITKTISNTLTTYKDNNINPKSFIIVITNSNDITESIEISNIKLDFIKNTKKENIINDIINDENSKLLKENKIEYKYLN